MTVVTTIPAQADSRIQNLTPDTNFGTDLSWQVGSTSGKSPVINRAVLTFPVVSPEPPLGPLISVNLFFRQNVGVNLPSPCRVYNLTGLGILFSEGFVTWNDFDLGSSWAAAGGDHDETERIDFNLNQLGGQDHNLDAMAMFVLQTVTREQGVFSVLIERVNDFTDNSTGVFTSSEAGSNFPVLTVTNEFATAGGLIPILD